MSPIGRVFIVLNLVLAGGFLVVSGTHLQQQHNYKTKLEAEQTARADDAGKANNQIQELTKERNSFENAKTAAETLHGAAKNAVDLLTDENKQYSQRLASMEGDVKQLVVAAQAANTEAKTAFATAKTAFDMATADQKTKDEAVRAKDAAVAENRELKNSITGLTEAVATRDGSIKGLESDRSQLQLLVKVAESYGFIRSMAAPNLAGLVTSSGGNLCTVQITDNPGNVNIKEAIELGKWGFAIYDANGYKGEAIAEKFEESANAVLCKIFTVKGEIKQGDKAATKTP